MIFELEPHNRQYVFMTDFDQTLSFNDSGLVLSEMLGIPGFSRRVNALSRRASGSSRAANWRTSSCTILISVVYARNT